MKTMIYKNCALAVLMVTLTCSPINTQCLRPTNRTFSEKFYAIAIPVALVTAVIGIPLVYSAYLDYCENQKSTPELLSTATDLAIRGQQFALDSQAIVNQLTTLDNLARAISVVVNSRYGDHKFPYLEYADGLKSLLTEIDRSMRAINKRIGRIKADKQDILEYEYRGLQQATYELSALHKKLSDFYGLLLETKAYRQQLSIQQQLSNIHLSHNYYYNYPNNYPNTYPGYYTSIGIEVPLN